MFLYTYNGSVADDPSIQREPSDEAAIIASYCFWHLIMMPALEGGFQSCFQFNGHVEFKE